MFTKLSCLICFSLVFALAGANVVLGDIWEGQIESSSDAVEDQLGRGMYSGSSDLELPYDGGVQVIGLRFSNVIVPMGASIDRAYIEFTADEVEVDLPVNLIIDGELKANPANFGSTGYDVDNRARTHAKASWHPEHFPAVGGKHQTSDISPVIEEIVNLVNWYSGADLVLIVSNDPDNSSLGHRTVETGGSGDLAPLLHIEWSLGSAGGPIPSDGQMDVSIDTDLSWNAGPFAALVGGQTVYFSENFDDANDGISGVTQSATTYDPGRLEYGTTYYWRVRQNNESTDPEFNEGRVWSFATEYFSYPMNAADIKATASSSSQAEFGPENTINGSGLDENDLHSTDPANMWLSDIEEGGAWIQYEFDKVYKLHEMWVWNSNQVVESSFGLGLKAVNVEYSTDGADWTVLADVPEFTQAPGTGGYASDTTVDFAGAPAKYVRLSAVSNWGGLLPQYSLSEIRFFYIPVNASEPSPAAGSADIDVDVVLNWRAGREAVAHDVYLGTDEQAVIAGSAEVVSVADVSYSPMAVQVDTSYYWKVDEVNEAEMPTTWESNVWSFTTKDHIVVDDFEGYADLEGEEIYMTWLDGFEDSSNGSQVGYLMPPYTEQATVHGGGKAMPFLYSNTGSATFSQTELSLDPAVDWASHGVNTLVLWFFGKAGNTGQLYVKINDVKIPYDGDPGNIAIEGWQSWSLDLASLSGNVQTISTLALGVDDTGATGRLFFDDIRLEAAAPPPISEWRITDDMDDVEEAVSTGGMDITSSDLELAYESANQGNPQIIGLRFTGIPVPRGVTITEAWVRFQVDETKGGTEPVNLIIDGELSTDALGFSAASIVSTRRRTSEKVQWSVPDWVNVGDQGPDQTTPSLVPIIQEIVNQDDWAGGSIVLIFQDDPDNPSLGIRCAEAGPGDDAPLLHISYE